jgi:hypothetical protein
MANFIKVPKMGIIEVNESNMALLIKLGLIKEDKPKKKKKNDPTKTGPDQSDISNSDGAIESTVTE